ncbi:MAG: GlxA family transcriptional regulator [Granulosicoccus sp.]
MDVQPPIWPSPGIGFKYSSAGDWRVLPGVRYEPDQKNNWPRMIGSADKTACIGFYLLPQFSMMAFTSALEALRMANQLSGKALYEWCLISNDAQPVSASSGIEFPVDHGVDSKDCYDAVFVCGGINVHQITDEAGVQWLRQLDKKGTVLGAICTGTYLLARSGLLDGYRCTIHWENLAAAREQFPQLVISPELFEIDRGRYTCAGGTAPLDMMLCEIRSQHGGELTTNISEQFMCERIRDQHDRQRVPLTQRIGASQPKLAEAVLLMEANIEEPMTLDELSHHVGVSRRQLERLFQRYLHCVPTRYYLQLRLERARQLLLQTSMPIVDVALACGFISAPHFSKCYRDTYSLPPRDERRRAAGILVQNLVGKDRRAVQALQKTNKADFVNDQT